ncbi:hypothetical protein BpHYR1_017748 [Brachionus plicatilis]|uniref:Uncharacterized protein n=1 Tax=Brachionus plicatilis TaxID=10195 RepID=A0A3M7S6X6_BRAPC|nr:hypothetical protein BpHYR1_017748 [Brachionus plicatilis]
MSSLIQHVFYGYIIYFMAVFCPIASSLWEYFKRIIYTGLLLQGLIFFHRNTNASICKCCVENSLCTKLNP